MEMQYIYLGAAPDDDTGDPPNVAGDKINDNFVLLSGPVEQVTVAASATHALVAGNHGATIILADAGATISIDAATLGDGFVCKIINDTGSNWTVPTPTGGTLRFDVAGHTLIAAGGSGALETYTRGGTRYVHVVGTTA